MAKFAIILLRRDMRINDNFSIAAARKEGYKVIPIFIFDPYILKRFNEKDDRRISFLANILCNIDRGLAEYSSKIWVFYGKPIDIIKELFKLNNIEKLFTLEGFDPYSRKRDEELREFLGAKLVLNYDHGLIHPKELLKEDGTPYKVFTPYMKAFRKKIIPEYYDKYTYNLKEIIATKDELTNYKFNEKTFYIDASDPTKIVEKIGYKYFHEDLWEPSKAPVKLNEFIKSIGSYQEKRDFLGINGTSKLSPYLRFGVLSVRKCYREALAVEGNFTWVNELIWREFYAYILYHFPSTPTLEFQEIYQNAIPWQKSERIFEKFTNAETGYPIIDAAIKQLLKEGWMHNRARMIVASFLCKNLLIDWRWGEEFFAKYLMDYDLASNVGGWQWAASTGVDAQPYFRVFNPMLQSQKFDSDCSYIKKYLPELKNVENHYLHNPILMQKSGVLPKNYTSLIVDFQESRETFLKVFKSIKMGIK